MSSSQPVQTAILSCSWHFFSRYYQDNQPDEVVVVSQTLPFFHSFTGRIFCTWNNSDIIEEKLFCYVNLLSFSWDTLCIHTHFHLWKCVCIQRVSQKFPLLLFIHTCVVHSLQRKANTHTHFIYEANLCFWYIFLCPTRARLQTT